MLGPSASGESTERSFGTIGPDGRDFTRLVGPGGPTLTQFERTDDGDIVFVASTPEHPDEIFTLEQDAETPLLIAHGKEGTRVHPSQSLELYRHLDVRKPEVPVRFVQYPGEGHGYTRSTAQLDFQRRMLRWFDTYLKDDGPKPKAPLTKQGVPVQP